MWIKSNLLLEPSISLTLSIDELGMTQVKLHWEIQVRSVPWEELKGCVLIIPRSQTTLCFHNPFSINIWKKGEILFLIPSPSFFLPAFLFAKKMQWFVKESSFELTSCTVPFFDAPITLLAELIWIKLSHWY